jgi:hypothetical protein
MSTKNAIAQILQRGSYTRASTREEEGGGEGERGNKRRD